MRFKQSDTFRKWHRKLRDGKARALIATRLHRLSLGHMGDMAPIGSGIFELRIHFGPGYRIYCQRRGEMLVLLLCAGDKGSQERDIETARLIAAQWSDEHD